MRWKERVIDREMILPLLILLLFGEKYSNFDSWVLGFHLKGTGGVGL